ncbi:T9SS type A sorting domain-containing protein [Lewinella sp. W8]|uniref:T9SS type A sorting domain-containing protein n=1 Tax=Lewinella sp. W8 TaxID=2528208 RepID=UPI00156628CD|nr:T9SS type A sorting domain-containing protein [Lewinella sp. W8]
MRCLIITLLVLLWGLSPPLLAQFGGGGGDGLDYSDSPQLTLDGIPSGLRPLYGGGPGDGVDQRTASAALGGQSVAALFGGGAGDGFDQNAATFGLSGQNLAALYGGSAGDGFDRSLVNASLGGVSTSVLYGGGGGDGFDRFSDNFALNGASIAGLYGGGAGDGFDKRMASLALDGTMFDALFGGGPGDGFDQNTGAFALSGQSLAILYGGGAGDGFDKATFDGVIPLPLTLISFDAFPEDDFVLLRWVTEDEVSTDFFTIEKTRDGSSFDWVGETPAAGFSEPGERLHYSMRDEAPYQGTSFYRLKTTDFDGTISLSHLVEVNYSQVADWGFTLFPNPNTGRHFSLRTEGVSDQAPLRLQIFDANGKQLLEREFTSVPGGASRFDLTRRLPSGSYLIRVAQPQTGETQAKILLVGGGE